MPPPTLSIVQNKTGTVQVRNLLNGTTLDLSQDGSNPPGATSISYTSGNHQPNNHLIEAFGRRWLLINGAIRARDEGGAGNWGVVYTPPNVGSGIIYSGLHLAQNNGVPTLCWMYAADAATDIIRIVTSTDGVSFSTNDVLDTSVANDVEKFGRSIIFGSSMYWIIHRQAGATVGSLVSWNLSTGAATTWSTTSGALSAIGANVAAVDFLVHKDQLYLGWVGVTAGILSFLYRLDGTTWVTSVSGFAVQTQSRSCAIISDGDDIIFFSGTSGNTSRAHRIQTPETTGSASDITTPVWDNRSIANSGNYHKFLDNTDPSNQTWYIWHQTSTDLNSGTYDCYEYIDNSTAMTFVGSGVAASTFTIPSIGDGGNDRIPVATAGRPEFDGLPEEVVGGRKRYFRVYGTGSALTLRMYHNTDREAPDTQSTFVAGSVTIESGSPATTPANTTSEITNITPDGGVALYSVIHDTVTDAITNGITHSIILDTV